MKNANIYAIAAMLLPMLAAPVAGKDLQAGIAKVAFRLPFDLPMQGYSARAGNSKGVLDPLQAKVLVLEGRDTTFALVTMDLGGMLPEEQLDEVRSRVKASCGIADVIFNVSHTHSGPVIQMADLGEWQKNIATDVAAGVERAWKARQPARIGLGRGSVYIGHNRLYLAPGGQGRMFWRNETKIRTSPVDPTVMVVRVDRAAGTPLAVVVNYACHPVVLGPENLQYSADYPGEMMRMVEAAYPAAPVCLFVQGGAGDINPYYDKTPLAENAVGLMRETGRVLGGEVLRVLKGVNTRPLPDAEIRLSREVLEFPSRWNREKLLARLAGASLNADAKARIERSTRARYRTPLTVMMLAREFSFVGVPGEIFTDYQIELRDRVRDLPVIFAGYTNGNVGYIPTIKAAVDGGYGASQLGTSIEVGAGDRLIDKAVIQLAYWLGKLRTTPDPAN